MTNWKEDIYPFKNFTEELTQEWINAGFSKKETREWLESGLRPSDAEFAQWLQDIKKVNTEWFLNYGNDKELREEFTRLSKEVICKIKDFEHSHNHDQKLNKEQELLVEELISNKELKERYKQYGLCRMCNQPNIGSNWCQPCNAQQFAQNFYKWTSGSQDFDALIQRHQLKAINHKQLLEWISYDQFANVEHLADGGFSKIYKAEWNNGPINKLNTEDGKWERNRNKKVILKELNNSQNLAADLLQEINYHKMVDNNGGIVKLYGISQDPKTKNYIMVMKYITGGDLRQYLSNNQYNHLRNRLAQLTEIVNGLKKIHDKGLIHRDLHPGNILNKQVDFENVKCYITDLGLSKPVNEIDNGKVYGVLPYVAPEILRGQPYTQASDIYSFAMIAYEVLTNSCPYPGLAYDRLSVSKICQGLRPNLEVIKIPQLLKDLVKRCWDADIQQRPNVAELYKTIKGWWEEVKDKKNTDFYWQFKESENEYNSFSQIIPYRFHSQTIYTSRLLDLSKLPQHQGILSHEWQTSTLLNLQQFQEIEEEIKFLKEPMEDELVKLIDSFIQSWKKMAKNKEDKQLREKAGELEEQLEAKGLSEEEMNKIVRCCEKLVELEKKMEKEQLQTNIEIPAKK